MDRINRERHRTLRLLIHLPADASRHTAEWTYQSLIQRAGVPRAAWTVSGSLIVPDRSWEFEQAAELARSLGAAMPLR